MSLLETSSCYHVFPRKLLNDNIMAFISLFCKQGIPGIDMQSLIEMHNRCMIKFLYNTIVDTQEFQPHFVPKYVLTHCKLAGPCLAKS